MAKKYKLSDQELEDLSKLNLNEKWAKARQVAKDIEDLKEKKKDFVASSNEAIQELNAIQEALLVDLPADGVRGEGARPQD